MNSETSFVIIWATLALIEAGVYKFNLPSRYRTLGVATLLLSISFVAAFKVTQLQLLCSIALLIGTFYRLVNLMRFGYARHNLVYLKVVCFRSFYIITIFQSLVLIANYLFVNDERLYRLHYLAILAFVQLVFSVVGLVSMLLQSKRKSIHNLPTLSDKALPTLSIAIPARNETLQLEECLASIVASDYDKLEVLVLDDCSQDRTSEIIRQFAHDGVRFVRGEEPSDNWLAKNASYQKLAEESSGEYILFCGADVRFDNQSLKRLISAFAANDMDMVSLLPVRSRGSNANSIVQQVRYMWELALPRFFGQRPPVLSTVWLIKKDVLMSMGGLKSVQRKIVPEGYFAKKLNMKNKYSFWVDSGWNIYSNKVAADQRQTAYRVRYPQAHKRPEMVMLVSIVEILVFASIIPTLIVLYKNHNNLWLVAATVVVVNALTAIRLALLTKTDLIISLIQAILLAPADLILINRSMLLYEFDEIHWKGRNVCLPVMQVIPKLPKI